MDKNEFHLKYRTYDSKWHPFDTLSGEQITFENLNDAETIIQHLASMDGVLEGVVLNQSDIVIQHWRYHWNTQRPELVEEDDLGTPNIN